MLNDDRRVSKIDEKSTKIGNKMIFSSKLQEMTNCSREIKVFSRDQMMLGRNKYGKI